MGHAYIKSAGMYVPDNIVTNHDLPPELETNDEWIRQRSGIEERRFITPGQTTSDLAMGAVQDMFSRNEVESGVIDCIIVATLASDYFFPGAAVFLQEKLGWSSRAMPCYDIRQQCGGFVYGLQMAQAFVETGMYRNVLLVGTEIHSSFLEFSKRGRAVSVLFGDGAACVVVSPAVDETSRILTTRVHADGSGATNGIHMKFYDLAMRPVISYDPLDPESNGDLYIEMPGSRNLFSNAVRRMNEVSRAALGSLGLSVLDVDWVVPHQANMRINNAMSEYLGIDKTKVLFNIHKYANTTSATIPLLLAEYTANGTIKRGDLLLMPAFGSGFVWGAAVVRY